MGTTAHDLRYTTHEAPIMWRTARRWRRISTPVCRCQSILCCTVLLVACDGSAAPTVSPPPAPPVGATPTATPSLETGRHVDVGGYQLDITCAGQGSPTVVLEPGWATNGVTSGVWSQVQPEVANITRMCVYHRAGLGRSDHGPTPRSGHQLIRELRAAGERAAPRAVCAGGAPIRQ